MNTIKTKTLQTVKIILLALILATGLQYVSAASWLAPTSAPPAGNTAAPINEGVNGQTKDGGLTVGLANNVSLGFRVAHGGVRFDSPSLGAPTSGYVLKSDGAGNVTWQADAVGSGGGGSAHDTTCIGTCLPGSVLKMYQNQGNTQYLAASTITDTGSMIDIYGPLQIRDGTQGQGKVFTSDGNGRGSWQVPSAPQGVTLRAQNCSLTPLPACSSTQSPRCPTGTYMAGAEMTRVGCSGNDNNIKLQAYCCYP